MKYMTYLAIYNIQDTVQAYAEYLRRYSPEAMQMTRDAVLSFAELTYWARFI